MLASCAAVASAALVFMRHVAVVRGRYSPVQCGTPTATNESGVI
jgi:hypothetical protein